MRRVSLQSARPGMIVGKAILGSAGQVLLQSGVEIKPQYLTYLRRLGIRYFYVRDSRMDDVEIHDVISEETRHEARSLVKEIIHNIQSPGFQNRGIIINDRKIHQTVTKITDELLGNKDMLAQLLDIRAQSDYYFAHSVNSCVLVTLVAAKMNYNPDTLKHLATGMLLHDIGMATVPGTILNKDGELTKDEYATVKNHPLVGYEIFKSSPLFSARAGAVLLQHHERFNGQGYPRALKKSEINPLAQIAGIADVYDSLTSERPYRKAFQPHQAVEMLMSWGEELFDTHVLSQFLRNIAAYPQGFHVFLSNGESGIVIGNTPGYTLRPVVRVLYTGEDLAPHPAPYDLDLAQVLDLTIVKVLE